MSKSKVSKIFQALAPSSASPFAYDDGLTDPIEAYEYIQDEFDGIDAARPEQVRAHSSACSGAGVETAHPIFHVHVRSRDAPHNSTTWQAAAPGRRNHHRSSSHATDVCLSRYCQHLLPLAAFQRTVDSP